MWDIFFLRLGKINNDLKLLYGLLLIRASGLFNKVWYLATYPDVAQAKVNPALHYLCYGGFEGRDPGPDFHSAWYLETYQDVKKAGINPLVHYLKYGRKEGREKGYVEERKNGYKVEHEEEREAQHSYQLSRMYDYSKQKKCIFFEDTPERIYLPRPKVVGRFSGDLEEGEALCPRPYVSVIEDATIFGGSSLVIAGQDHLLNDEMVDFTGKEIGVKSPLVKSSHENTVLLEYRKDPDLHIQEGILLSCDHDNNYFHWLVECLPKLMLVDELEHFRSAPLLIPKGLHRNLEAALTRINVNKRPLIFLEPNVAYQVERLIYPSALSRIIDRYQGRPVFNMDIVLSRRWLSRVREGLMGAVEFHKKPWRKLFLTRKSGLRALGNRDQLELMLLRQDFQIVELDGLSLDVQIELFSQAAIVVAPTGAALTNMLFCQPGTKVIIFMSNHEVTNFYFWTNLSEVTGLDVEIVAGQRLFNLNNYWSVHDDYIVDPEVVLEAIKET